MPTSNAFNRLRTRLESAVGRAIGDYALIQPGDVVLACVSGGKDSHAMLDILRALQRRAPVDFRLVAVNVDQKQPGFPEEVLPAYFESIGVDYRIVEADSYSIVREKIAPGKTTCSLCSRLRRGVIYRVADEVGATKIALGHHRDDIVETFFLNLFFGGKAKAMPPKLRSDDGRHVVIRPMAYCRERDIAAFARQMAFPIIPCDLCGSQEQLQRRQLKDMLAAWEREYPGRVDNIFRGLQNVVPSHLADPALFDFRGLGDATRAGPGDTLFDPPDDDAVALALARSEPKRIVFVRRARPDPAAAGDARPPSGVVRAHADADAAPCDAADGVSRPVDDPGESAGERRDEAKAASGRV
jgi:tRNA 2-thiocytidine biosynthesis protein TtcA